MKLLCPPLFVDMYFMSMIKHPVKGIGKIIVYVSKYEYKRWIFFIFSNISHTLMVQCKAHSAVALLLTWVTFNPSIDK